jgi:hypothetical protein
MNSSKPAFQEFVEANQGLITCYNAVSLDDYKKMGEGQRDGLCASQKERVREILRSNQLVMSNLVRERVDILHKLGQKEQIVIRK